VAGINLEKDTEEGIITEENEKSISSKSPVILNINLLGYEVREELAKSSAGLKFSKPLIISLSLILLALLINIVSYFVVVSLRDEQIARKEELERRKAELEAKNKELTDKTTQRDILVQKKNILLWASGNSFKWSNLLEEIRDRTPSNLWITKIDVTDALQINIGGETFDHKTVALFLANLQDSPKFKNVILDFTKKNPKIKLRQLESDPTVSETDRAITSDTKFNIRAEVVIEAK
jgi:Tfp pilus assembly protein PilN